MQEVKKGDTIEVKAQGMTITGTVYSASHYGESGWYIEIEEANVPGGYSYWKQGSDGGSLTKVNGKEVL